MTNTPPVSPRDSSPQKTPPLPSRPSTHVDTSMSDEETKQRINNIGQTWLGMQSMLARINNLQLEEMRKAAITQKRNEARIDMLEKDLNMLRGHLNKSNRHIDGLVAKEAKRALDEQDKP